jgi:8-oxo-dGTP pyrophosphatase MutT (NUDIX family)
MGERTPTARDEDGAALVGALIVHDGMLLLGRRSFEKAVCPDTWDVIGGHVEAGETVEDALLREVEEEIGIRPLVYGEHSRHSLPQGGMLVLYLVTHWAGGEPRLQDSEHIELGWFPIQVACTLPHLAASEYVSIFRSLDLATHVPPEWTRV